jgi:hypothetical protein
MNLDQIQRKLLAAARAYRPSERVPYAFEQRIMARVRALPVPDEWAQWARALWNAAAPCVAIMILLSAWSLFTPANPPANPTPAAPIDLSQALQDTILAAADQDQASPTSESLWTPPPDSLW